MSDVCNCYLWPVTKLSQLGTVNTTYTRDAGDDVGWFDTVSSGSGG